ncbi:phosphoserine phosphatase SerB [Vibrio sp. 10N.286.49.C2]|uniref:phosphoserine phosphatase n=1 Tax=unclassified Vibrio TaxID=2614977 RepID=UPI000C863CF7|nr:MULTISPECIES: phosphoserine phosphatase [unclassified Vibrio]PMH29597.1 phosphoserine phosphatase SerB [Vibrio sp. 10N.286.49.C2]PMH56112.1 phosphoserine phosphatase SerB [Vibrio sp. 10N.286.49.B1]PMH81061.1 phosphoserine phosphatase SerB [Vibrio sp. 10N.286.48.B7]
MDAVKPLTISKRIPLKTRFPETLLSHQLEKSKSSWIVYAPYLSVDMFNDMDSYVGSPSRLLDAWQVGEYEVALMAGRLTPRHEAILSELQVDFATLCDVPDLNKPGVIVLDMDSTAIQIECIDEIATLAGVGVQVAAVTERAMQGELDFEQSLRQRVGALKGADESILSAVRADLPMMPELREMIKTFQLRGWKTAIASGGFTYFSDFLKQELSLDYAQSNTLEIIDGKLTGEVIGDIVDAEMKADILQSLAEEYDIEPHNTIAVGDGANDLVMMHAAGLGIAYHAKPKVEEAAQVAIRFAGLGGVVCILSGLLAKQKRVSW